MARIDANTLNLSERIIRTNKVQKTTKGGRTMSWSSLIVVGDREGYVGAGIGKARAIPDAIRKGTDAAKKNMIKVPLVNGTIPHEVLAQHGASQVLLRPAAPGTGVVAGGAVRILLEEAGVQDVLAKSLGSNNPVNNAWATIKALESLRTVEQVATLRGKSVDELRRGSAVGSGVVGGIGVADAPSQPATPPQTLAAEAGQTATDTVTGASEPVSPTATIATTEEA